MVGATVWIRDSKLDYYKLHRRLLVAPRLLSSFQYFIIWKAIAEWILIGIRTFFVRHDVVDKRFDSSYCMSRYDKKCVRFSKKCFIFMLSSFQFFNIWKPIAERILIGIKTFFVHHDAGGRSFDSSYCMSGYDKKWVRFSQKCIIFIMVESFYRIFTYIVAINLFKLLHG